jgi:hypothetical protein
MRLNIASIGLSALISLAPVLMLAPIATPAAATTYKNDYIPKRSDSYQYHIGHMLNESKQRARAGAEYMRRHHLSLF